MHLLATRPGGYAAADGIVDLGQTPADLVLLSAADTDLALLASACDRLPADFPSVRLANLLHLRSHASVDLYMHQVLDHARAVVVSVIGGVEYWSYGIEQLAERAARRQLELIVIPGDDTPDPSLMALSSVGESVVHRVWRYLREGGPSNARALLELLGHELFGRGGEPPPPRALPRVLLYHPAKTIADLSDWQPDWERAAERAQHAEWGSEPPVAALLFYRAHLQAGNLAAFDLLIESLCERGLAPLPIAVASLKDSTCRARVEALLQRASTSIVLNTTGFAIGSLRTDLSDPARIAADEPLGGGVPILQVIASGSNTEDWREDPAGLQPHDLAMNVVLPEVDGRIITRAVSFKELARRSERTQTDVVAYQPEPERTRFVAELAARWVELARTPASKRRIALVLANYPARDGRLGNGVGLDTPASTIEILRTLARAGYRVESIPEDGTQLMRRLQAQVTNTVELLPMKPAHQLVSLSDYASYLDSLPADMVASVNERWDRPERDPHVRDGALMVSGLQLGSIFVGIQPARGYERDPLASYHDPDLVPPHAYLAFYAWLRNTFRAHAVVHVGKHGNLEWLPGKSVALGPNCWPDALLGPMPHLYPFIVNDPGEGSQAKRRSQAVVVDHLVPPLTRAETYGPLRELEVLVDEYYQAITLDPRRADLLRKRIWTAAAEAHLVQELGLPGREPGIDDADWLVSLDAYLCELKESQIRDGLHVFGRSPEGALRSDTLVALARHSPLGATGPTGAPGSMGLLQGLSRALLGADFDPLDGDWASPWLGSKPAALAQCSDDVWRTHGDTRERLELYARALIEGHEAPPQECASLLAKVHEQLAPALDQCGPRELDGLLSGLAGRFVPPGPSGAPTRGRPDVLPTGRNFFSVDVRSVPTQTAWALAQRAAERLVERHVQDHGEYPTCIGLSIWGTATMRTGGDDVAQALALMGVRPVWDDQSARVVDSEILPLSALGRPRVDVVLRISGFFRDAFPELIILLDAAVRAVSALDEPAEQNPLRARVLEDERALVERGTPEREAAERARWRIFGSKPGSYGAGLQGLIDQRNWQHRSDLATAYLNWSGFAYASEARGTGARGMLELRLASVEAVLQNQDNREHDLLDSDDYYQFQGGMSAAVEVARGAPVPAYVGDHSNPDAPRVRTLREEIQRVFRSRVINPKWISGVQRHGYKGAAEMAATLDFLFAYDATTGVIEDYQYAMLADAYLLDENSQKFLRKHNPSALFEMTERLLEAIQREMWCDAESHRAALEDLLLDVEEADA